jgi:hypothetical protein
MSAREADIRRSSDDPFPELKELMELALWAGRGRYG